MMIIEFEDRGQGFLEWLVDDETGKVLNCKPHHGGQWIGKYVFCHKALHQEHCPLLCYSDKPHTSFRDEIKELKYPIKQIKQHIPWRS